MVIIYINPARITNPAHLFCYLLHRPIYKYKLLTLKGNLSDT
jgi:hypothetical protein